jgi:hypothetical protein
LQKPGALATGGISFVDWALLLLHKQTTGLRRLSRINENGTLYLNGDAYAPARACSDRGGFFFS